MTPAATRSRSTKPKVKRETASQRAARLAGPARAGLAALEDVKPVEAPLADTERPLIDVLAERQRESEQRTAAAPKGPDVLVDLDEGDGERPNVRLEGELYPLAIMDDFSLRDQRRLNKQGREFLRLHNSEEELTEKQEDALEALMEDMFGRVFRGPESAKAKMGAYKRSLVVLGFTLAPAVRAMARENRQTRPETETPDPE